MRTAGLLLLLLPACGCWRVLPTSSGCRQACFSAIDIRPFNDGGRVQHSICTLEPLRMLAAPRRAALLRLSLAGQAADEDEDGEDEDDLLPPLDLDDFDLDFDDDDEIDVSSLSEDEVEDLLFNFDESGLAKPWALKPHLSTMLEGLREGNAALIDVRPQEAFIKGHLEMAISIPIEILHHEDEIPAAISEISTGAAIYVLSGGTGHETQVCNHCGHAREKGRGRRLTLIRCLKLETKSCVFPVPTASKHAPNLLCRLMRHRSCCAGRDSTGRWRFRRAMRRFAMCCVDSARWTLRVRTLEARTRFAMQVQCKLYRSALFEATGDRSGRRHEEGHLVSSKCLP